MKKDSRYRQNQAFIHQYSNDLFELVVCKSHREEPLTAEEKEKRKKGKNTEKLDNNVTRAKSTIFELAICNIWAFFVTFTINKEKCGRYDLDAFYKQFAKWVMNYNQSHGVNIKYLLVPEKHLDGAWHLHGFIWGIPPDRIRPFTLQERLPNYIRDKLLKGEQVYEWLDYRENWGFNDLEPIRSREGSARYVTKYITEELMRSVNEIGKHLYYCSKGLQRRQTYEIGSIRPSSLITPDYENDYVIVKWLHGRDQLELLTLNLLLHSGPQNTTPIIEPTIIDRFLAISAQKSKFSFGYQYSLPV